MGERGRRIASLSVLAAVIALPLGILSSASGEDDPSQSPPGPPPSVTDDVYQESDGVPTIIVLESCIQVREEGRTLPSFCDEMFENEAKIREEAESLPDGTPMPEDFGLGSGGGGK